MRGKTKTAARTACFCLGTWLGNHKVKTALKESSGNKEKCQQLEHCIVCKTSDCTCLCKLLEKVFPLKVYFVHNLAEQIRIALSCSTNEIVTVPHIAEDKSCRWQDLYFRWPWISWLEQKAPLHSISYLRLLIFCFNSCVFWIYRSYNLHVCLLATVLTYWNLDLRYLKWKRGI